MGFKSHIFEKFDTAKHSQCRYFKQKLIAFRSKIMNIALYKDIHNNCAIKCSHMYSVASVLHEETVSRLPDRFKVYG